jgi:phosphocarrier protein
LKKVTLTISNQRGLHARAAAKFVKLAGEFLADITVAKDGQEVSGLSIMGLMMLAAAPGDQIEMTVAGDDADEALKALRELVENKFEEN